MTRTDIEKQKLELAEQLHILLTDIAPNEDEDSIITNIIRYMVKSHDSFENQAQRLNEFYYILKGIEAQHGAPIEPDNFSMFENPNSPF